jgi:hypothetical protein
MREPQKSLPVHMTKIMTLIAEHLSTSADVIFCLANHEGNSR